MNEITGLEPYELSDDEVDLALVKKSAHYALLQACKSALALINIATPYAGMTTARELEAAISEAENELAC